MASVCAADKWRTRADRLTTSTLPPIGLRHHVFVVPDLHNATAAARHEARHGLRILVGTIDAHR
ncbi:hypothetical protein HLY00_333 [Mycolicibacterium hippocampi]|uniref:Uncharacterized protein n=1 Tax=Mycolicibacterium hippocampi TaxID=659824 RepID=A0A850PEM1_9MYCO|nr:hypothetical protein [Mycolicibacterium hippocampi]